MNDITTMTSTTPVSTTDKLLIILCHLSTFLGAPIILPLIVFLVSRHDQTPVPENAREALNFHISIVIYGLCCVPLILLGIGIFLAAVVGIAAVVLAIVAAVKASNGVLYRYPCCLRLVPA